MGLVKAKCSNCGANLKVDNLSKTGICTHCGASYMTEDIIVNNITNINYSESINGTNLNRQAVLEKLLIEYYSGKFNDIDNIKEYALKVQEYDLNNVLAHFVVFDNIDSKDAIMQLLGNKNLNISLNLFIVMLNICIDDLNKESIVNNIIKYKSHMDAKLILEEILNKCLKKDFQFLLNILYNLKLSASDNDEFLCELYDNAKVNKITMLSQLELFSNNHKDFMYNQQLFESYAQHWKKLKEKQKLKQQTLIQKELIQAKEKEALQMQQKQRNKKKLIITSIVIGFVILTLIIVLMLVL